MDFNSLLSTGLGPSSWEKVALSLLLAFVLGKLVSLAYEWTYEGLSYQRSFVQALQLGALVAAILMLAIGDNLARGLGILGTMALVRFRTNVRDARDMIFIFAALAVGVATGVQAYSVAVIGALAFGLASAVVEWSPFARRQQFDGMVRFWLPKEGPDGEEVSAALSPHCRRFVLVALRDLSQGEALEYAYQVRLKKRDGQHALVRALESLQGIGGLTLLLQDAHTEL
jgi:uncharacterized membrane protein YhiD involved in acid resistance